MKLTISSKWCEFESKRLLAHATDSIPTWTLLNQMEKYFEYQERASKFKKASQIKNIVLRKEYLSNHGLI